ncbi:MAG: metallophosphoesterase family protein [Saprospiraceae bacterium]|nr:metallophosphoesterase family protein [Saprospiraceae bacterium]
MMKIGILSDTHGFLDDKVFKYFAECEEIWHAGDIGNEAILNQLQSFKPLRAVYGNIDDRHIRATVPETEVFQIYDKKIAMIHIAGKLGNYTSQARDLILLHRPDILVCGHSHILKIAFDDKFKLLYINPGAVGISGFHQVRTMIRIEIKPNFLGNAEVIELGNRSIK